MSDDQSVEFTVAYDSSELSDNVPSSRVESTISDCVHEDAEVSLTEYLEGDDGNVMLRYEVDDRVSVEELRRVRDLLRLKTEVWDMSLVVE